MTPTQNTVEEIRMLGRYDRAIRRAAGWNRRSAALFPALHWLPVIPLKAPL